MSPKFPEHRRCATRYPSAGAPPSVFEGGSFFFLCSAVPLGRHLSFSSIFRRGDFTPPSSRGPRLGFSEHLRGCPALLYTQPDLQKWNPPAISQSESMSSPSSVYSPTRI